MSNASRKNRERKKRKAQREQIEAEEKAKLPEVSVEEFKKNLIDYEYSNFEEMDIDLKDTITDIFYNFWGEQEEDECGYRYVMCAGKKYKWTYEEDGVCEMTNEHTIMYHKNIFEEVKVINEINEK